MKSLAALAVAAALFAGSARATTIEVTYDGVVAADGTETTAVEGATVFDFNDCTRPAGYSGDGQVVSGSVSGQYAAPPLTNTTCYLSVPRPRANGQTETFSAGGAYNYFGLFWGSMDSYNTLSFWYEGSLVASYTGTDVAVGGANGDQSAGATNRYVNFFFTDGWFDTVQFTSNGYAFESDNHAIAQVPEPTTLSLLGLGLLGIAASRRRRS